MYFERFIAGRFMPRSGTESGFSGPLSAIAVASVALGVTVMIMAVSILRGFQGDIAGKVVGFGSHLTVRSYEATHAYEEEPVEVDSALEARMRAVPGVRHLQRFATKGGMVKTEEQIYGIVLRGLSADYDTTFFSTYLTEGHLPKMDSAVTNEVLVSSTIARKLKLDVGDKMRTYFWQGEGYRSRAFTVGGIYNTDLTEMDEVYVVGDLRQVQRLNGWGDSLVGGYELLVEDFDRIDEAADGVLATLPYDLTLQTVVSANPVLFSWLDLLNTNIRLILAIMSLVCAVAVVSALLIMIFEKSATIGLLKTMGATDASIRRIFMIKAGGLIAKGVAIGCGVALALCWVQKQWQLVKLDAESYSMSYVPVEINVWTFVAIGAGAAAVCVAALLIPAAHISRISPAITVRSEK